jgi:hypothetical protein
MSGYEIEMCLIDERGDVSQEIDKIMALCKAKDKKFPIVDEVSHNMVEINALPHSRIQKTALYLLDNVKQAQEICLENNLSFMPLGTYPGKFKEKLRKDNRYIYSAKALDEKKYSFFYPRCFGFHYHYTLPRGMFNNKTKFLNNPSRSRVKTTLLSSYNLFIAIDPIITTISQSSPFAEGKYFGKDSRMIFWRGGKKLKYDGMFNKNQMLGGLQPYKQTLLDLMHTLEQKDKKVKRLFRKAGVPDVFLKKKKKLDLTWNPVKINKLGTLEHRGMDSNYIDINLSLSVMMKFLLRAIQQDYYHVVPSDIGIDEPFKLEGNIIFVPPHTHVRNVWQYKSAYKGLADDEIYKACTRFYNLCKKLIYKEYHPTMTPVKKILNNRVTVSDEIISQVKKKGYSLDQNLPQEVCRQIALNYADKLMERVDKCVKIFQNLDES